MHWPRTHGLESHSLMSCSQLMPVYPALQEHVYLPISSMQEPWRHGFELHSFMSISHLRPASKDINWKSFSINRYKELNMLYIPVSNTKWSLTYKMVTDIWGRCHWVQNTMAMLRPHKSWDNLHINDQKKITRHANQTKNTTHFKILNYTSNNNRWLR